MPRSLDDYANPNAWGEISAHRANGKPAPLKDHLDLGVISTSEIFPKHAQVSNAHGWFRIHVNKFLGQTLILALTGGGKTELQKRKIYETLWNTDWNIVVVDAKGDRTYAEEVAVMANKRGLPPIPILKLGWRDTPSAVFNAFVGDSRQIYNQLVTMLQLEPSDTDADFYKAIRREILQLVCCMNTDLKYGVSKFEPPRSFQELEDRVTKDWLEKTYATVETLAPTIKMWDKAGNLMQFRSRISADTTPFLNVVDPRGFKLGDHRVTFFSIDATNVPFDAEVLFRLLAGSIRNHLSIGTKKTLFIFDEFKLLGPENVVDLINTGRGRGGAFVLATQSLATLGPQLIADQILDGVNIRVLMKCEAAEDLVKRFGMKKAIDTTDQSEHGAATGKQLVRRVDKPKLDSNKLKELHDGQAFFELDGKIAKIQTVMVQKDGVFDESMEDLSVREDVIFKRKPKDGHGKTFTALEPE